MSNIFDQKQREEEYRRIWAELYSLADSGNTKEFILKYVEFLKKDCVSRERQTIVKVLGDAARLI